MAEQVHSIEEFVAMSSSEDPAVNSGSALVEATSVLWLEIIERHPELRRWVAHNKTVPIEILEVLAHDKDVTVRQRVATRRKLSEQLFSLLSTDADSFVRCLVARNRKAPFEVLRRLADDQDADTRISAIAQLTERFPDEE